MSFKHDRENGSFLYIGISEFSKRDLNFGKINFPGKMLKKKIMSVYRLILQLLLLLVPTHSTGGSGGVWIQRAAADGARVRAGNHALVPAAPVVRAGVLLAPRGRGLFYYLRLLPIVLEHQPRESEPRHRVSRSSLLQQHHGLGLLLRGWRWRLARHCRHLRLFAATALDGLGAVELHQHLVPVRQFGDVLVRVPVNLLVIVILFIVLVPESDFVDGLNEGLVLYHPAVLERGQTQVVVAAVAAALVVVAVAAVVVVQAVWERGGLAVE